MEAPPRLVLVPGLDGTGVLFQPFLRVWNGPVTVLPLPANPAFGYDQLLQHLRSALPLAEPFVLLGESFSGPLAVQIAAAPPANLLGVVLCVSFVRNPLGFLAGAARALARPSLLSRLPRNLVRRSLLGDWATPELELLLDEALRDLPAAVVAARIRTLSRVDATTSLHACGLPLLVLSARADALVPRRCATFILGNALRAEGREFPGPHLLLQTQPEAAAATILGFMQDYNLLTLGH